MKLADIAEKISAHLSRFERDPVINAPEGGRMGTRRYYNAGSCASGRYVGVTYVSYQGVSWLTREQAWRYLEWLDAGNVGTHHQRAHELVK